MSIMNVQHLLALGICPDADAQPKSKPRLTCGDCGAAVTLAADGSFVRECAHVGAGVVAKVSADLVGKGRSGC